MEASTGLRLPVQSQPVSRKLMPGQGHENAIGVQISKTPCDQMTGLAQQMCFATLRGVST